MQYNAFLRPHCVTFSDPILYQCNSCNNCFHVVFDGSERTHTHNYVTGWQLNSGRDLEFVKGIVTSGKSFSFCLASHRANHSKTSVPYFRRVKLHNVSCLFICALHPPSPPYVFRTRTPRAILDRLKSVPARRASAEYAVVIGKSCYRATTNNPLNI